MRKKKLIQLIERKMLECELENQFNESQSERAYSVGYIDGLGEALFHISPKRAKRNPLALIWYTEDEPTQTIERQRERVFEIQHISDARMSDLFETAEAE